MANKEQEKLLPILKLGIPICAALPFNLVVLRNEDSGNCMAVTEKGECPHAKRRHHAPDEFECRKDTLMRIDNPTLMRS
jgi:hypothetical protein